MPCDSLSFLTILHVQDGKVNDASGAEGTGGTGSSIDEGAVTSYAKNLVSLADALVDVDRESYSAQAEAIIRRAAQVLSRTLGPLRLEVAEQALVPLARVLGGQRGVWSDAAQTLLRARSIMLTWLPPDDARVRSVSEQLAHAQAQVEMIASSGLPSSHHGRAPAQVHAASLY